MVRVSLSQYLVYRLSFILWRLRVVLNLLFVYFLWTAVFSGRASLFGYSQEQMITYVLLIYFLGDIVFSSRTGDLANYIRNGDIINFLIRPIHLFQFMFAREFVDKLINIVFSGLEIVLLVVLFRPDFFVQTDVSAYVLMALGTGLGLISAYFTSLTISLIAFWTAEVWAPRFVYFVLLTVLAGSYYPLDVLPPILYNLLLLTPFPYFAYLPAKIFIEGPNAQFVVMLGMSAVWAYLSYLIARLVWRKGIKEFSFYGR